MMHPTTFSAIVDQCCGANFSAVVPSFFAAPLSVPHTTASILLCDGNERRTVTLVFTRGLVKRGVPTIALLRIAPRARNCAHDAGRKLDGNAR